MGKWWQKLKKSVGFWLIMVIIIQTVVYALAGVNKSYIHMDEAYSLGLAQYHRINIQDEGDFYNHWHDAEYYEDYLAVQDKDRWNFVPVYENQKNDVHPPLFYAFLRGAMEMVPGRFSKWPGIILNIIFAAMNTVLMYLVVAELVRSKKQKQALSSEKKWRQDVKIMILVGALALTAAAISAVVYIRMYMMLTMMVTLTLWLHLKMYQEGQKRWLLGAIGVVAFLGVLTQYYYVFFLAPLYVVMAVKYVRERRGKELAKYTVTLGIAGVATLLVWPHLVNHMLFGYRGQGVLQNLMDWPKLGGQIWRYILVLDYYEFHRALGLIVVIAVAMLAYRWRKNEQFGKLEKWNLVVWPTVGYFLIVAAVSPFIELRYIMPVCGLIGMMVIVGMWKPVSEEVNLKNADAVVGVGVMVILILLPVQLMSGVMKIELLYVDRRPVMEAVSGRPEVPILYFLTTENNRFLDNILPFAVAEQSYLALDVQVTDTKVKEILAGKNLSDGLYLWVGDRYDQEEVLTTVEEATGLEKAELVQRVNTADVFYLTKIEK